MKTLLVITGPTAVGKTQLGIHLAQQYDIPIINADSRQIYRDMRIGTAQPTDEEQRMAKHYFVGTLDMNAYYNASMYEQDVMRLLSEQLFVERDVALMSGGSMMYIDAVCNGIDDIPTVDDMTRDTLKRKLETEGLEKLCDELKILDPEHYKIVDLHNTRRVVHALEICYMTGKTYTSFRTSTKKERPFHIVKIGLNRERETLYNRINARVDQMISQGLEDEARKLYSLRHLNALNTVGYKEMFDYFSGVFTQSEAIERIKGNTRRYARKQLTWYKRDPEMKWFLPDNEKEITNYIASIIKNENKF